MPCAGTATLFRMWRNLCVYLTNGKDLVCQAMPNFIVGHGPTTFCVTRCVPCLLVSPLLGKERLLFLLGTNHFLD